MLFLLLIGTCFSINHEGIQPMSSKIPSMSLMSIARTNPLSLIKMLNGADPDTIRSIVKILEELITDVKEQRNALSTAIDNANNEVEDSKKVLGDLRRLEGEANELLKSKETAESEAKGAYDAILEVFNSKAPSFEKEINILTRVIGMLDGLNNQKAPEEKELLELGSTEKGKVYLKLLAKVQADPQKLQKIIGFVQTLLDGVTKEKSQLVDQVSSSKQAWTSAQDARIEAESAHEQAVENRKASENKLAMAEGKLSEAQKAWDDRSPALTKEENTLTEVIRLLNSTADK